MTEWRGLTLVAGLLAVGCPEEDTEPCDGPVKAFRVLVAASDGPLPPDTALAVHHGTGIAEYHLDQEPDPSGHVLFCEPATRAGEPIEVSDGGPIEALVCALWTDGAARVIVTATGYPKLDEQLDPKLEGSCLRTLDVDLLLERGDATP
jgi:hypothetical protein